MSRARIATVLLASLVLAACSPLGGPRTEFRVFAPTTTVPPDAAWPQADWQLTVMAVAANPAAPAFIFQDEFDGPAGQAPDTRFWGQNIGNGEHQGWGNQELAYYTAAPRNAALDG